MADTYKLNHPSTKLYKAKHVLKIHNASSTNSIIVRLGYIYQHSYTITAGKTRIIPMVHPVYVSTWGAGTPIIDGVQTNNTVLLSPTTDHYIEWTPGYGTSIQGYIGNSNYCQSRKWTSSANELYLSIDKPINVIYAPDYATVKHKWNTLPWRANTNYGYYVKVNNNISLVVTDEVLYKVVNNSTRVNVSTALIRGIYYDKNTGLLYCVTGTYGSSSRSLNIYHIDDADVTLQSTISITGYTFANYSSAYTMGYVSDTNCLIYQDNTNLVTINITTGVASIIPNLPFNVSAGQKSIRTINGTTYVACYQGLFELSYSNSNYVFTQLFTDGTCISGQNIILRHSNGNLIWYTYHRDSNNVKSIKINKYNINTHETTQYIVPNKLVGISEDGIVNYLNGPATGGSDNTVLYHTFDELHDYYTEYYWGGTIFIDKNTLKMVYLNAAYGFCVDIDKIFLFMISNSCEYSSADFRLLYDSIPASINTISSF